MIEGQPVKCLLDSGSEVSTLTESCVKEKLSKRDTDIIDTTGWIHIKAANSLNILYIGYLELDVNIHGHKYYGVGFMIVKDPTNETIQKKKSQVPGVIGSNIFQMVNENKQDIVNADANANSDVINWSQILSYYCNNDNKPQPVKLFSSQPILIPAYSMKVVNGSTNPPKHFSRSAIVQAVSGDLGALPRNIMLINTCVENQNGHIPLRIVNIGSEDAWLNSKCLLGTLQYVEVASQETSDLVVNVHGNEICVQQKTNTQDDLTNDEAELPFPLNIKPDILSKEETIQFTKLVHQYIDVFSVDEDDLGYTATVTHKIPTVDELPVKVPHRTIPPNRMEEVKQHIQKLLRQNIIRPSTSPYAAPVVLVRKPDNSLRLCVDYRQLNMKTVKDAYPLPRIQDAPDALRGSRYFSSLDLTQGYHQMAVDKSDVHKTAFRVGCRGLYEYVRMPFGLCNAPASFSRLMEACLGDQNYETLLIYLDDILVFSSTVEQHMSRLQVVFERLRKHGLKLKPKKCHFFKPEVKYLGHIVSSAGVATDPDKTREIQNWKIPETEKELRSFLGLASYYRRFVSKFATIAAPLHDLLGGTNSKDRKKKLPPQDKPNPFKEKWNESCSKAFNVLKEKLVTSPILGYPDFSLPFIVETDASHSGLGAVISQKQPQGQVVIAYASRALRPSERNMTNYSTMKLELLAMKRAITDKFRDYLLGSKFIVLTDNNPLSYLKSAKLGVTELRWASQLAQFNFDIQYRCGKENTNADSLSRKSHDMVSCEQYLPELTNSTMVPMAYCNFGFNRVTVECQSTKAVLEPTETFPSYSKEELCKLQSSDPVISRIWHYLKKGHKPTCRQMRHETPKTRKLFRKWDKITEKDGILYLSSVYPNIGKVTQLLLPEKLKSTVLESLHNNAGHQGYKRTLILIRTRCFWPGMVSDIQRRCYDCEGA